MLVSIRRFCLILLSLLAIAGISTPHALAHTPALPAQAQNSLAPMLTKVMPAVVNISARGNVNARQGMPNESPTPKNNASNGDEPGQSNNPNTDRNIKRRFESIGSGVIMDASKGYILTNAHLVHGTDDITVTLSDGRHLDAKLMGIDNPSDIAVLQVKAPHLQSITTGNSSKIKVGDFVAAIGSPFGLKQTVTSGIVSGLERSDIGIEGYEDFIQTDAPINPGNSGGALVNIHGQLIGINTAILAPDGGNIGIGFAIPINMAKAVMEQLIAHGHLQRGIVGVIVQTLTPELADGLGVSQQSGGGVVTEVKAYSSAQNAGLKVGDIITAVNGSHISTANQVRNMIGLMPIDSVINITALRQGKAQHFSTKVMDPKTYTKIAQRNNPFLFGAIYNDFNIHTASIGNIRGVQLLQLSQGSPLARARLRPGDIIIAANGTATPDYLGLQKVAQNTHTSALVLHVVRADGDAFFKVVNR